MQKEQKSKLKTVDPIEESAETSSKKYGFKGGPFATQEQNRDWIYKEGFKSGWEAHRVHQEQQDREAMDIIHKTAE